MGTWAPGSFHNDDVMDWLADLHGGSQGWEAVTEAMSATGTTAECSIALAAAELVAALGGTTCRDFPFEAKDWLSRHKIPPGSAVKAQALAVVQQIRKSSALADHWKTAENAADWVAAVTDLENRLVKK